MQAAVRQWRMSGVVNSVESFVGGVRNESAVCECVCVGMCVRVSLSLAEVCLSRSVRGSDWHSTAGRGFGGWIFDGALLP